MGLLSRGQRSPDIENMVKAAKAESEARDELIGAQLTWITRVASRVCRRYISRDNDDEYAVALAAFNEAIDSYSPSLEASFPSFAEQVIRRRLIDYFRREQRRQQERPWSGFQTGEDVSNVGEMVTQDASLAAYQLATEAEERRQEIISLSEALTDFGASFSDLVNQSPQHADARENAMRAASIVARCPEMLNYLLKTKTLPLKQLTELAPVSRKTLERQRKYIIALVLILTGDFPYFRSFIQWPKEV